MGFSGGEYGDCGVMRHTLRALEISQIVPNSKDTSPSEYYELVVVRRDLCHNSSMIVSKAMVVLACMSGISTANDIIKAAVVRLVPLAE